MANSYLPPTGRAPNFSGMPSPASKPLEKDGTFAHNHWRYLNALTDKPPQELAITIGATPTSFTAPANGSVIIVGGTISSITLARNAAYNLPITIGMVPMSNGDVLTVAYSVQPTMMVWLPR